MLIERPVRAWLSRPFVGREYRENIVTGVAASSRAKPARMPRYNRCRTGRHRLDPEGRQLLQEMNLALVPCFIVHGVDDHATERAIARGRPNDAVKIGPLFTGRLKQT